MRRCDWRLAMSMMAALYRIAHIGCCIPERRVGFGVSIWDQSTGTFGMETEHGGRRSRGEGHVHAKTNRSGVRDCDNLTNITTYAILCIGITKTIIRHVDLDPSSPAMGARPHMHTSKVEKCVPPRPAGLHGSHDQEGARTIIQDRAETAYTRRDGHTQDEKAWEVAIGPAKQLPMNAFGRSFHFSTYSIILTTNQACT